MGARFSAPVQTGIGAHPASYTMGTSLSRGPVLGPTQPPIQWVPVFPGDKVAGAWRCQPTLSSAGVNERVELYLYSPSGPSWSVLGWTIYLFCFPVTSISLLRLSFTSYHRFSVYISTIYNYIQYYTNMWQSSYVFRSYPGRYSPKETTIMVYNV
jgi:hypothetical protein